MYDDRLANVPSLEFRIEVYVPPYLASGLIQPTYTLGAHDWAYGVAYTITNVVLHQGPTSAVKISLVAGK